MAPVNRRPLLKAKTHVFQDSDLRTILSIEEEPKQQFTGTKVLVTIGPACQNIEVLQQMLEEGMASARVDLTWGTLEYHRRSLSNLMEAMKKTGKLCSVVIDTVGRELMIRRNYDMDEEGWPKHLEDILVSKGNTVVLTTDPNAVATSNTLPINYANLPSRVREGDTIFVGRYLVSGAEESSLYLEVTRVSDTEIECEAKNNAVMSGLLTFIHSQHSDLGLENVAHDLPLLSQYDMEAIKTLASQFDIDYVAASYTRTPEDMADLRQFLDNAGMLSTKILAKIEDGHALRSFQGIAMMADGIILSRGNIGLDVPPEKIAVVQKQVIGQCNNLGKPVILTRIVDTMVQVPRPTRAEATDVANAVLDGTDGVLLGAETLRGKYPLITLATVLKICREAEAQFDHSMHFESLMSEIQGDFKGRGSDYDMNSNPTSPSESFYNLPGLVPTLDDVDYHMPKASSFGSVPSVASALNQMSMGNGGGNGQHYANAPVLSRNTIIQMSKLEALASSAVRAATKIGATLIIVFASTGRTASLVAKYRPPMPIFTVVVPRLVSTNNLHWELQGKSLARQCNIIRGILPICGAPAAGMSKSDNLVADAVAKALQRGLVTALDHVVCVMAIKDDMVIKVVSVDEQGIGMKSQYGSLVNLSGMQEEEEEQQLVAA